MKTDVSIIKEKKLIQIIKDKFNETLNLNDK